MLKVAKKRTFRRKDGKSFKYAGAGSSGGQEEPGGPHALLSRWVPLFVHLMPSRSTVILIAGSREPEAGVRAKPFSR